MALGEVADLAVRLSLDDKFSRGLGGATRSLGKFEGAVSRVGRGAGQLSSGLARAGSVIGVGVATGLVGAAKAAIDFEDAFAGVRKTVDEADLAAAGLTFEDLEKSFRDMAKTIPISATEFARLGETAGALGVAAGDIDEFVETTALMGVTTNLSADEAADAFGRIGTILNLTGDDYEELADSIVALGNAGASTESEITEITKRFAGSAKSAGLAKEEIVALASATASLGFAPERGGTALANVFSHMSTQIALGGDKGKAFSKLLGRSLKDLRREINQGKGLPLFMEFLGELKGLKKTDADKLLANIGIRGQAARDLLRTMADNLPELTRQLEVSTQATGALGKEAQKRFDTVASKIAVFKNNLIDAAITIGEGMIPAIGRATEKLTAFLQQPENVTALRNLGADIGKTIDDINWDEVIKGGKSLITVMKSALDWAKRIFDVFNALPTEIKGAIAGLLVLNKLSGGLVGGGLGNIAGGILGPVVRNLGAAIPGVGKAFVQPVFVTNFPPGGLGGGPGGAAGGGKGIFGKIGSGLKIIGAVSIAGASIVALAEAWGEFQTTVTESQNDLTEKVNETQKQNFQQTIDNLEATVGGINEMNDLQKVLAGTFAGGQLTQDFEMAADRIRNKFEAGQLTRDEMVTAIGALTEASVLGKGVLELPKTNALISDLITAYNTGNKGNKPTPGSRPPSTPPGSTKTRPAVMPAGLRAAEGIKPLTAKVSATNVALSGIKTGIATTSAAQKAELGNIKNAVVTMNATQRANAIASIAATTAGNLMSVFQSASQVLAAGSTTRAVNSNAAATRGVAPPITAGLAGAAGRIVAAIYANRPIINTTNVSRSTTVNNRYGPSGGSATTGRTPDSYHP